MAFFHISQGKYLKRMYAKIENFYTEVESNIKSNVNFSINDINENPILNSDNDSKILTTNESIESMAQGLDDMKKGTEIDDQGSSSTNIIDDLENTLKNEISSESALQTDVTSTPRSIASESSSSSITSNSSGYSSEPKKVVKKPNKMFM